jgi:aspartyl protease family protein
LRVPYFISILLASAAVPALAAEVSLIGVFPPKAAVLVIDGAQPKSVRVGGRASGVLLIAVERESAVIEVDGVRRTLRLGPHYPSAPASSPARQSVALAADALGHFITEGLVNGGPVRFLIDTGASVVALPARDAHRLGIDYRKGRLIVMQTANGPTYAHVITLDTVKVGGIELHNVEAAIHEQGLGVALLGMSFLNRVEMRNEGQMMTLTRRY